MEPPDPGSSKTGGTSEEHSEPSGIPGFDKKRSVSQMEDTDVTKALPGSSSGSGREGTEDVGTPQPTISLQRRTNMLQDCRDVDEFEILNKISAGSYGIVYRAKDKQTGEVVALKKLKAYIKDGGFPMTSLREINILYSLSHPSVVHVKEVVVGSSSLDDSVFLVMEHMEYELKGFMEGMIKPFNSSEVKCLMLQLLEGVSYLHDNWIIHRDLKTANLLLDKEGNLKICDFGLSRQYGCQTTRYTPSVVTLWYRAPELLLGAKEYSTAIDMWSVGCILAELLAKEPLFNGNTDLAMLTKMYSILGTPDEKTWPGLKNLRGALLVYPKQPKNFLKEMFPPRSFFGRATLSDTGLDLLNRLLSYDPDKRITAKEALMHPWFSEAPLPQARRLFPANLGDTSHWHGWLNVRGGYPRQRIDMRDSEEYSY